MLEGVKCALSNGVNNIEILVEDILLLVSLVLSDLCLICKVLLIDLFDAPSLSVMLIEPLEYERDIYFTFPQFLQNCVRTRIYQSKREFFCGSAEVIRHLCKSHIGIALSNSLCHKLMIL